MKAGRTDAPEALPVKPVDVAIVEKTLPLLPPIVADMVMVQMLLGCRPGSNRVREPKRQPGERYLSLSYARAVERACDKAFVAPPELN